MDISKARCANCEAPMTLTLMVCRSCNVKLEGEFEVPALARLSVEDQVFVMAFLRHHGSITRMEGLFGISYPTVKNRLNAIVRALDETFNAPSANSIVLEMVERGEISVDEALKRLQG